MDKEAIRSELKTVQAEIKKVKSTFFNKKDEKEEFFSKGEEYSNQINALYEEVKKIEQEHHLDKINEDLDSRKEEFEKIKASVEEAEKAFQSVKKSSRTTTENRPEIRTISVDKAKKEIKSLDLKLQTQVLSLNKEQDLIKEITELKSIIDKHSGSSSIAENSEIRDAKRELNSLRRKFNNYEKRIRSLYKQIRLISKEKKSRYKQIDDLRDLKKKAFEDFRINKKDYSAIGKDLKSLFKKEEEFLIELGESPVQKKKIAEKQIKEKRKEIEDKFMKKGHVLTTEDLLMFQSRK